MSTTAFDSVERIADAVLYEGYVLYPYRASAAKNQYRWQFGVVAPRSPHQDGEPSFAQTECLVAPAAISVVPTLTMRIRFLRPRPINGHADERSGLWLEGVAQTIDIAPIALNPSPIPVTMPVPEIDLAARLTIEANAVDAFIQVRLRIENIEPWRAAFDDDRDAMLRYSLVGTHLLLAVDNGRFESLIDPAETARTLTAQCRNLHTWPVLVGDRIQQNLMLSSPIVLYDFPSVAKESRGDLCDAAEIDEILTLRILTMTEAEKQEARRTDPRAREILDSVDAIAPSDLAALHGTLRSADFFNPPGTPSPEDATVDVGGCRIARGSHVRLRPNRRADAMDMFLRDQLATVTGIYRDVDDRLYVAVTVDADPAASLHESFGRFFYFDPTEIEPIEAEGR
jgi:hypothetical protein